MFLEWVSPVRVCGGEGGGKAGLGPKGLCTKSGPTTFSRLHISFFPTAVWRGVRGEGGGGGVTPPPPIVYGHSDTSSDGSTEFDGEKSSPSTQMTSAERAPHHTAESSHAPGGRPYQPLQPEDRPAVRKRPAICECER